MIFGTWNPEKISHANLTDLSTSPVRCSHFTLGNTKMIIIIINRFVQRHKVVTSEALKSSSTVLFVHTSDYLCCLRRKQTVIHLPTATWKCHHTNLWTAKLFHLTEGLLHSFKRWASCGLSSVALKRTSCDMWQLECQASNVTASGSKWPPSALIGYMLPVFLDTVRSHSTPRCAEIQPMLQQAAAASLNMSIMYTCSSCSMP